MAVIRPAGSTGVAAAVTPVVSAVPLPELVNLFNPPTVIESTPDSGSLWGRWGKLYRGVSVLKFGTRYVQYRMPTEDDIRSADLAYIGGRVYEVDDTEAAHLIEAGYGSCLSLLENIPVTQPGDFGGAVVAPAPPRMLTLSPPPATADAVALAPTPSVGTGVFVGGSAGAVRAPGAGSYFVVTLPTIVAGTPLVLGSLSAPTASAGFVIPVPLVNSFVAKPATVVAVPAVATAPAAVPVVSRPGVFADAWPASF